MKAFNSYIESTLVDLKNSKFLREESEKSGLYTSISIRQKTEEGFNILICEFILSDSLFLECSTFRELSQFLNSDNVDRFAVDNNISLGYVYSYIASLWSQFNAGNEL